MNLRVSRPALIEAFKRQGKDINNATQQEMRSLVCAQCHEEYYFKKGTNYLTFPFDKGQTVEAIEQYYDEQGFTDYVHKLSKTPILKAQPRLEHVPAGPPRSARRGLRRLPYALQG